MYADTLPTRWRPICNLNNETNYATEKPGVHALVGWLAVMHWVFMLTHVNLCLFVHLLKVVARYACSDTLN